MFVYVLMFVRTYIFRYIIKKNPFKVILGNVRYRTYLMSISVFSKKYIQTITHYVGTYVYSIILAVTYCKVWNRNETLLLVWSQFAKNIFLFIMASSKKVKMK